MTPPVASTARRHVWTREGVFGPVHSPVVERRGVRWPLAGFWLGYLGALAIVAYAVLA